MVKKAARLTSCKYFLSLQTIDFNHPCLFITVIEYNENTPWYMRIQLSMAAAFPLYLAIDLMSIREFT